MFTPLRISKFAGILGIVAMFGIAGAASAQVSGTKHNLNAVNATLGVAEGELGGTEVCAFCHTPHNANPADEAGPLWNRVMPSTTYDVRVGATLGVGSTSCLSCHDGAIALNDFGGAAWDTDNSTPTGDTVMSGSSLLDSDLTNQHPIGVTYAVLADEFKAPDNAVISDDTTVECSSCHDPHGTSNTYFLRADNSSSGLCTDCHIK